MELTERQQIVLLAVLSYAYSNTDDLNEALAVEDSLIEVGGVKHRPIQENEIDALMLKVENCT